MVRAIDSLLQDPFGPLRELDPREDAALEGVRSDLQTHIENADLRREQEQARAPLSDDRRQRFTAALTAALAQQRAGSLAAALASPREPRREHGGSTFGLDTLVPRSFFADTDVHADPEELAQDLASSIIRGEERAILAEILPGLASSQLVTLDEVAATIQGAGTASVASGTVIATNSFQAWQILSGDAAATQGRAGSSNLPVHRVYDERPPFVAVLSASGAPAVHVGLAKPSVDGDIALPSVGVVVGVTELDRAEMDDIVASEDRTQMEEARLRGSVRVRIQEEFEVEMEQPDKVLVIRLPDDTW